MRILLAFFVGCLMMLGGAIGVHRLNESALHTIGGIILGMGGLLCVLAVMSARWSGRRFTSEPRPSSRSNSPAVASRSNRTPIAS